MSAVRVDFGVFRDLEEHQVVGEGSLFHCHHSVDVDHHFPGEIADVGGSGQGDALLLQAQTGATG